MFINKEISGVLRSAMVLLKKRIVLANKNYDKISALLQMISEDEELSAKDKNRLYSAISELEISKLSDISALVSKLLEKLPDEPVSDNSLEIIISDH